MNLNRQKRNYLFIQIFNVVLIFLLISIFFNINITGLSVLSSRDYRVYIINAYEDKDVTFLIPFEKVDKEFENFYAEIRIYDLNENEVAFLSSDKMTVSSNNEMELKMIWKGSGKEGNYQARIFIFEDDESYSFSRNFKLEREILTFESVIVRNFFLGEVVNFSVLLKNHRSDLLFNVSVSILILNKEGKTISEIVSEKKDIPKDSFSQLEILWDTKEIKSGRYNAKMIINYDESFINRDLIIEISQDNFNIIGVGYSIFNEPKDDLDKEMIIYILIGLLIIVNIAWVLYYKIKIKK
jgi:hypothetical protein